MVIVGCAGFSGPATKYFKEYSFVEIQETHVAIPGGGTVRRWRREAPDAFQFALLAPRQIGQEGFRTGKIIDAALADMLGVAEVLGARTGVFTAPQDFPASRPNKAALKTFLDAASKHFDTIVFDPGPAWAPDEADELAEDAGAIAARDPLHHGPSKRDVAYYRLPGPAGHKSRYEDPAIERLGEIVVTTKGQNATYVFANVDMFADAKRLKRAAGL